MFPLCLSHHCYFRLGRAWLPCPGPRPGQLPAWIPAAYVNKNSHPVPEQYKHKSAFRRSRRCPAECSLFRVKVLLLTVWFWMMQHSWWPVDNEHLKTNTCESQMVMQTSDRSCVGRSRFCKTNIEFCWASNRALVFYLVVTVPRREYRYCAFSFYKCDWWDHGSIVIAISTISTCQNRTT